MAFSRTCRRSLRVLAVHVISTHDAWHEVTEIEAVVAGAEEEKGGDEEEEDAGEEEEEVVEEEEEEPEEELVPEQMLGWLIIWGMFLGTSCGMRSRKRQSTSGGCDCVSLSMPRRVLPALRSGGSGGRTQLTGGIMHTRAARARAGATAGAPPV